MTDQPSAVVILNEMAAQLQQRARAMGYDIDVTWEVVMPDRHINFYFGSLECYTINPHTETWLRTYFT